MDKLTVISIIIVWGVGMPILLYIAWINKFYKNKDKIGLKQVKTDITFNLIGRNIWYSVIIILASYLPTLHQNLMKGAQLSLKQLPLLLTLNKPFFENNSLSLSILITGAAIVIIIRNLQLIKILQEGLEKELKTRYPLYMSKTIYQYFEKDNSDKQNLITYVYKLKNIVGSIMIIIWFLLLIKELLF